MKLHYTNTLEDVCALNNYHASKSPAVQKALRVQQVGLVLAGILLLLCSMVLMLTDSRVTGSYTLLFIGGGLFSFIQAYILPRRYNKIRNKTIAKLFSEGENKRLFCEHELEVVDDGVIERTPYSETKMAWGTIERIEATSDYTYLYLGAVNAYIIPNKRVPAVDLAAFMHELKANYTPDQTLQTSILAPAPLPAPVVRPAPEAATVSVTNGGASKRWYSSE